MSRFAEILAVIAEAPRAEAYMFFSDDYKSHYGIRPRFAAKWSLAKLERASARLWACECPECCEMRGDEPPPPFPTSGEGWTYTGREESLAL